MNREQSLKFVNQERAKTVGCAITGVGVAGIAGVTTSMIPSKNYGIFLCALTLGSIAIGKLFVNRISFYKALREYLNKYPSSYIDGEPEEFIYNEDRYCDQYVKAKRRLHSREQAISKLEVLE